MQSGNLTEAGESGYRQVCKLVDMFDLVWIAQTTQDAVVEDTANRLWFSGAEGADVAAQRIIQ